MNEGDVGSNGISTFSYANTAQPVDQAIVLTPAQLQAIIEHAVKAATEPLLARISSLEERLARISPSEKEEISETQDEIQHPEPPSLNPDTHAETVILDHGIRDITHLITAQSLEDVRSLRLEMEEMYNNLQLEIAMDRQRITRLERPVYGRRSLKRLDELHDLMIGNRLNQVTFTQTAKLLGITYRRAKQLRQLIENDPRFTVVKDPRHKTRRLIRLNRTDIRNGGR